MNRAYIGLGANLGDASASLARAIRALADLSDVQIAGVSRLYATSPVGVVDQPEFRNAVVALDVTPTSADPGEAAIALLVDLKRLERAGGRAPRERWGPREIDLDLLAFGRHRLSVEVPPEGRSIDFALKGVRLLEVPHAAARERLFVLAPWADLAPRLVPPGWGERVDTARRRREVLEGPSAVRPIAEWDPSTGNWHRATDGSPADIR